MDISDKHEGWIETGTAVGTGILAWEYEATRKWAALNPGYASLFSKGRFMDALAGLIGKDITKKIFPDYVGVADVKPNIMGAINKTSMTGVGILIVDSIVKALVPQYKKFPAVSSIVRGAGIGLIGGGIVGGIFDPAPNSSARPTGNGQASRSQNTMFQIAGAF